MLRLLGKYSSFRRDSTVWKVWARWGQIHRSVLVTKIWPIYWQVVVILFICTFKNYTCNDSLVIIIIKQIYHCLFQTFKAQIDKPDQYNGPILAPQDTKTIFGNIPPIYEVHCKLKDSLAFLVEHWSENNSIGECILNRVRCFLFLVLQFLCLWKLTPWSLKIYIQ